MHELNKKPKNEMGGVGIADNLRNLYRIYFWVRNMEWWCYIFFWSVGVILTNAYIIYILIHNMHGNPKKHRLSHQDFRKSILCAWIKTEKYSSEKFEVQSEILSLRRKRKLDLSSYCSVSIMKPDRAWKGRISIRTAKISKEKQC